MKTILLLTATLLTLAFARPTASGQNLILFSGFVTATETAHVIGAKVIVDGSGSGYSTLGAFSATHHYEVSLVTGQFKGTSEFAFEAGDSFTTTDIGLSDLTGAGNFAIETALQRFKTGTGRFASNQGDLTLERYVHTGVEADESIASFKGEYLEPASK